MGLCLRFEPREGETYISHHKNETVARKQARGEFWQVCNDGRADLSFAEQKSILILKNYER